MANTYDLTQTGSEVQAILNDANNIKGAGAQTTLTTDYILLKDTNGQYHKILKDSFTEACRNVLAGLLVNNDKGTTISQIAAVASGDFGSVTPANLASVLGAANAIPIYAIEDCDAPTRRIHYISGSNSANRPIDTNGYLITEFSYYGGVGSVRYSCQWAYIYGSSYNDIYFRTHSGYVWNAWRKVAFL